MILLPPVTSNLRICRSTRESGFSLIEAVISLGLLSIVVGGVFNLVWRVERGYTREKQVAEMQQNERYALELITRIIRSAGNNPQGIALDSVTVDPDGSGVNDDIRIQSDFNPADGDVLDDSEDVLIRVVDSGLRLRNGPPGTAEDVVSGNIFSVRFSTFDGDGSATTTPSLITRVDVTITARTSWNDLATGTPRTKTLTSSVQLRR